MFLLSASALLLLNPGAAPATRGPSNPAPATEAQAQAQAQASELDRIICRKFAVTGSRTDFVRECRTAREWNRQRSNLARGLREQSDRASAFRPSTTPGSE
jgi:hypothetical protein